MTRGKDGIYRAEGQQAEDLPELEHFRGHDDEIICSDECEQWLEEGEDCVGFFGGDDTLEPLTQETLCR